jgi:hypothetical protein
LTEGAGPAGIRSREIAEPPGVRSAAGATCVWSRGEMICVRSGDEALMERLGAACVRSGDGAAEACRGRASVFEPDADGTV